MVGSCTKNCGLANSPRGATDNKCYCDYRFRTASRTKVLLGMSSGYYRFSNVNEDELHLRVEKEHFDKEDSEAVSRPTILSNGDVPNYAKDPQQIQQYSNRAPVAGRSTYHFWKK